MKYKYCIPNLKPISQPQGYEHAYLTLIEYRIYNSDEFHLGPLDWITFKIEVCKPGHVRTFKYSDMIFLNTDNPSTLEKLVYGIE